MFSKPKITSRLCIRPINILNMPTFYPFSWPYLHRMKLLYEIIEHIGILLSSITIDIALVTIEPSLLWMVAIYFRRIIPIIGNNHKSTTWFCPRKFFSMFFSHKIKIVADMRSFIPSTTFHVACLKNHKNVVGTYDLCQGTVDFTPAHNNLCIGTTSTWFHCRCITAFTYFP